MNQSLISSIRNASHPLAPIPTGVESQISANQAIRAVLFDIYGTLLVSGSGDVGMGSSAQGRGAAAAAALTAVGVTQEINGDRVVAQLHKTIATCHGQMRETGTEYPEVDMRRIWSDTLAALAEGGLPIDADQIAPERLAVEYENRVNPVWPMPSAPECLQSLLQRGLILGIVSNAQFFTPLAWTAIFGQSLEEMGVATNMQFLSYQHHQAKPGDSLYLQAGEMLAQRGVSGRETLYIGNDMRNDILPAARVGFVTGLFAGDRRSLRLREDDPEIAGLQPDLVVTDLLQILDVVSAGPR